MSDLEPERRVNQARVEVMVDEERGVFMISVAAELADMHPQTLRIYESKGLIQPKRSPKNTRLYSQRDVERLRRIQQMTNEEGLNLAGVETVLEMEAKVSAMRSELEAMRARTRELEDKLDDEIQKVHERLHTEIVPYGAYDSTPPTRIPVQRPDE
ncbi:MAG: helix-turn-helix transcriptional regulator [Solirubrobacterales bacterium]